MGTSFCKLELLPFESLSRDRGERGDNSDIRRGDLKQGKQRRRLGWVERRYISHIYTQQIECHNVVLTETHREISY